MGIKLNYLFFIAVIVFTSNTFGQSLKELEKLKEEYKNALERQAMKMPEDVSEVEKALMSSSEPSEVVYSKKDIESLLINTETLLEKLKAVMEDSVPVMPFIGYDIFTQRDSVPYWLNIPIPKYYNLGPGDEVIISVWGESDRSDAQIINRDGQIYVENIGILNLGGKTVDQAKKFILSKYSRVYSTLEGSNPKSYIDITLGELKSVNVHFVGFVNIPGVHMIHPFSNVISGLTQAGGIKENGSLREVHLIRDGKTIGKVDIYKYIFSGENIGDLRLIDQDVIYVPPRKSTIPLTGHVRVPGYYEMNDNESVKMLIDLAGGKKSEGAKTIFVYKNNIELKNRGFLLKPSQILDFYISDGDSIHVPMKPQNKRIVRIGGQIKNPGEYPYQSDMTLQDLIDATMSLDDSDFMETVDLSKIIINRKNPSAPIPKNLFIDLYKNNIVLKNGDHINVSKKNNYKDIESIVITGEVNTPGIYAVNNLTTLSGVLSLAGGYTDNALFNGVEVFRDTLKIAWEDDNFIMLDGDSINVVKKSGLVLVKGEVNAPGYLSYKKGESIKKYIRRAGGYSAFAEEKDVLIIYPNGTAVPKLTWSSPTVIEGSTIVVNQRTVRGLSEKASNLEAFTAITAQASNIATTLVTIILLINQSRGSSGG
tara:strand:+ start:93466 stop:95418 length:1953 start_codon:yes stop_codon:yes gene_type:complete